MSLKDINFILRGGKNVKALYFIRGIFLDFTSTLAAFSVENLINELYRRDDCDEIIKRVNYYCKAEAAPRSYTQTIESVKRKNVKSVYYYDFKEFVRGLPATTKINFLPGDINYIADRPSLTKTRPVGGDNKNNVLLNFNRIRHNIFVNDTWRWDDKIDGLVFRGKLHHNPKRVKFFERYFGSPGIDIGDTNQSTDFPAWRVDRMPISEQLRYKFVLSLEGNDVASNLKWVLSSRSLAVMPEPEFESWFMEGLLQPDVHYLRIEKDYSDLSNRLNWALTHPRQAEKIIDNANSWIDRFRDKKRERLITQLVVAKYLGMVKL